MKIRMDIEGTAITATLLETGYASGLVKLGRFDSGVEASNRPDPVTVTIELIER